MRALSIPYVVVIALALGCSRSTNHSSPDATSAAADAAIAARDADPPPSLVDGPSLDWVAVKRSPRLFSLFRLPTGLFITAVEGNVWEATSSGLQSRSDYRETSGARAPVGWVQKVHGHFPTNAWMLGFLSAPRIDDGSGRSGLVTGRLFRWQLDHWVVDDAEKPGVAWSDGRVLVSNSKWVGINPPSHVDDGGTGSPLPEFAKLDDNGRCSMQLRIVEETSITTNGHVFALGSREARGSNCFAADQASAIEHFVPGKSAGQLLIPSSLTKGAVWISRVDAASPEDVLVAGYVDGSAESSPYLARYDGQRFRPIDMPITTKAVAVVGMTRARDGAVWLATSSHKYGNKKLAYTSDLLRRTASGLWQRISLPRTDGGAESRAVDVATDPSGAIWIAALVSDTDHTLYRLAPN